MNRKLTLIALIILSLSIALGAFGAHALKEIVSMKWRLAFETAVKYQMYGALLLLILSFQPTFHRPQFKRWIALFLVGLACFSGSIYGLVAAEIMHAKLSFLGPITPLGGLLMISSVLAIGIKYATNKAD